MQRRAGAAECERASVECKARRLIAYNLNGVGRFGHVREEERALAPEAERDQAWALIAAGAARGGALERRKLLAGALAPLQPQLRGARAIQELAAIVADDAHL